jgi:MFS family permease
MLKKSGYYLLLKKNPALRNLWYGQVISELGDWLNSIAIYALILELGGSGIALACTMMAKLLPFVFVSPIAGVMIDRVSRKKIMIASDVLRFFTVLGLLWIDNKGDLWMLYTLVAMEIALSAFFEPARSAIIPAITKREDLGMANALGGATWSVMLALGTALGGAVVSLCGIRTAFVVDALSFLLSAVFIARIPYPENDKKTSDVTRAGGFGDMIEGFQYLLDKPVVLAVSLLKTGLAIAGGIMTLIPLYAHQMFSTPSAVSFAIGAMYSSRGVGAAIGPLLVKHMFGDSKNVLQIAISASFILEAVAYLMFSASHSLWSASLSLFMSTLFGSIIWVFSTTLLHMEAEDRFLGRIFSSELALMTLVMGISNLGAGVAVDRFGLTPNDVMFWVGVFFFLPGILWSLFFLTVRKRAKPDHSEKKLSEDIAPLITLSGKEQEKILDHLPIK